MCNIYELCSAVLEEKIFKVLFAKTKIFAFWPFSKSCQNVCWKNFNMILTNYDGLESDIILTHYEAPTIGSFREEVENVKTCFWGHNIITNVGSATNM